MPFLLRLDERSRRAGRFIGRVHRELQKAFAASGLKQADLARRLEIDRGLLNKRLSGENNLTLRTLSDLAWAMDRQVTISLDPIIRASSVSSFHTRPIKSIVGNSNMHKITVAVEARELENA